MNGATLDLTTSIVNLRRLADKIANGETIALPRAVVPAPAPVVMPTLPPPPPPVVAMPTLPPPPPVVAVVEQPVIDEPSVDEPVIVEAPAPLTPVFEIVAQVAAEVAPADGTPLREGDLARLEQVRAEVGELSGRRLSPWTRRRLEEAQAAEREILERLGFDSYLDVMLAYAAGSPQSEPGLAPSSKLPSLASFASLPSMAAASGDGGVIDNGGSDEGSVDEGPSVHEIGERFAPASIEDMPVHEAPAAEVVPEIVEPEIVEPDVVDAPAGPSTIADWLRGSSFAGARGELVDVNAGA